jgi:flagellin
MALTVNTNVSSLNAQRNLGTSQASLNTSLQRLSSGLRINSAKDDAAGLAISERFTSQIRGNEVAVRNANDGISLSQTAEGALSEIGNNLQRMRELAVQASNATNSDSDRASLNQEVQALATEIDRVAQGTTFNGTKLLDGSFSSKTFQVGANNQATDKITIANLASARTSALGGASATTYASTGGTTAVDGNALAAGDVNLNGVQVGASVAGTSLGQTADSAFAKAAAINAVSSQSGVTAKANATTIAGAAPAASGAIASGTFNINGVNIGAVAAGGNAIGQGANVAASINEVSSQTGVIATANTTTGAVTLTAADGRNIAIGGTITNTGLTAATTRGTITLESSASFEANGGNVAARIGVTATNGTPVAAATVTTANTISNTDVLTATNALKALDTIDGALQTINSSRAALGAVQNRFSSVVANQQTTIENLSASRGRIQDADFAKETANLSRAQVLQQAGTAMLSQANQSSQGVLSLLR